MYLLRAAKLFNCAIMLQTLDQMAINIESLMTTNLRFYLLYNCENYRNIDFSVINKDRGNWVKVVIRSNSCVISLVKIFIFIEWLYSTPKVYVM